MIDSIDSEGFWRIRSIFRLLVFFLTLIQLDFLTAGWSAVLKEVCGPQAGDQEARSEMLGRFCQAAYANGNAWVIGDNNARVFASAAVVCAHSCMSGGFSSCSSPDGGGGSPCSTAVRIGTKAYNYNNFSSNAYRAAQENGSNAISLFQERNDRAGSEGNRPESNSGVQNDTSGGSGSNSGVRNGGSQLNSKSNSSSRGDNPGLPDGRPLSRSCRAATSGGSIQDRIACAGETDPNLPQFVKGPEFAKEFKQVTGVSLQEVINQPGPEIVENYGLPALKNAYLATSNGANDREGEDKSLSFGDFLGRGTRIVGGILENLNSPNERNKFVDRVVPSGLRGLAKSALSTLLAENGSSAASPSSVASASLRKDDPNSLASVEKPKLGESEALVAENGDPTKDNSKAIQLSSLTDLQRGGGGQIQLDRQIGRAASGVAPENDPTLSLFARVTFRYQQNEIFRSK